MRLRPLAGLLVLPLALGAVATAAADEAVYAKYLEEKSASVVALKFVLKMGERERNVTASGVLIDPAGVVMLPSSLLRPRFGSATPKVSNLRVIFPGDEKEFEAIVGATDTTLGLAFLRIRDLAGKKVTPVDLSAPAEPKLGDELFYVGRLEQGFDYAPVFGVARVAGQVTKPRSMWYVTGVGGGAGTVLFAADGRPAGVMISQSGVSDEDFQRERSFLLPMKSALPTLQRGIKAAETALAEDAARAKEEGEGEKPEAPEKPSDPPGMN
jgi:hypothetical protein